MLKRAPSLLAYLLLVGLTALAFYGLIGFGEGRRFQTDLLTDPYVLQILYFSLLQAGLSTLLSVLFAWPIARAIYRLNLWGAEYLLKLSLLAFVMPTLVLITGAVILLGPSGLLRPLLGDGWSLYGLNGILLAHVFLNMPLAVRVLTQAYRQIPDSSVRLAQQLKFSGWQRVRLLELPQIRPTLIAVAGLIFILCFNSFAIVLALGGGPAATTFELAIYQALKYDFNLDEALTLAWMQFALAGTIFLLIAARANTHWLGAVRSSSAPQPKSHPLSRAMMLLAYLAGWVYLLLPILALLVSVLSARSAHLDLALLADALYRSLLIALLATLGALVLCYLLLTPIRQAALSKARGWATLFNWLATHTLVAPAMVLSTGLYIFLLPRIDLDRWGLFWLVILNLVVLVPFLLTQLRPALLQFDQQYAQLLRQLKLKPLVRLRITLGYARRSLVSAFSLGLLLALGDVSIFAIFGQYDQPTLPWLIYRYAASYQMPEATLAALLLLTLCVVLLMLLESQKNHE